ncbi:CDP-2,3-bis-(O-geranylgeranyl)-sn-glycerol synthase [Methylothermus subterraneus]
MLEFKLQVLLLVANSAPVLAFDLMKDRLAWPVDLGLSFCDGRPLLGPAKTWRGLLAALMAACLAALLLGLSCTVGLTIGAGAMAGDMLSSFFKRRLNIETSGRAMGLDQIPESLLPLLLVKERFDLDWHAIALLVAVFFLLEVSLSPLLYRLGLRKRPY